MIRPIRSVLAACCLLLASAGDDASAALRFTDVTATSGVDVEMVSGGESSSQILEVNGGGVALFDYDRDGDLDLFLANGATMDRPEAGPGSRLYANDGDGTFTDVTEKVGLDLKRWAMGVAVGDYDGDGDDDVYVTCYGPNALLENDVSGLGTFRDVGKAAGVADPRWGTSAAFADLDGDADLDLYVVNYLDFDTGRHPSREGQFFMGVDVFAGPRGLAPQPDVLYENLGNGTFRDATTSSGCVPETPGYGLGVRAFDANGDGRVDVFVGNDSTENFLFRNESKDGKLAFEEIGVVSGVAANYDGATQATMGIAIGDVDGNGFPDLFTTNFSSDTNTLHLNRGKGWFDDRTSQYGLGMISRPYLGWGTGFYDFDLDGDEDLFVANGHVYPEASAEQMDSDYLQPLLLFDRRGDRFALAEDAGDVFAEPLAARATAFGDLDRDGDVDVVVLLLNGRPRVLRNEAPDRPSLTVAVDAPGVTVDLRREGTILRRWVGGGSYQSVDAQEAYFALLEEAPYRLTVRFAGGKAHGRNVAPDAGRIVVKRSDASSPPAPPVPVKPEPAPAETDAAPSD